jgi:hypothetical protein
VQGHRASDGRRPIPYTRRYLGTLRNHFSTVGVNGVNEMVRNFTRDATDISDPQVTCSRSPCSKSCASGCAAIRRGNDQLIPRDEIVLCNGDVVRVVGKRELLDDIRRELGNSAKELVHPNPGPIFLGIFLAERFACGRQSVPLPCSCGRRWNSMAIHTACRSGPN